MIKGYFFDLDGVVFNTEPLYTRYWSQVGERLQPQIPDFAMRIKGQTLPQIFDAYFSGALAGEQESIVRGLDDFEAHMDFEYVPGFLDFASWLKGQHVATALVTSSNHKKMENVYRCHPGFQEMFEEILTAEDFAASKPSPDCYLKAAKRFGLSPDDCVGFEDSFNGLKSLKAAHMKVVGLATTNSPESISALADFIIKDYTNLDALISRLRKW